MLPSVCAARFFGCTAMPASMAHQTLCTLILPLARSTDTSATPAASVSSFTMVATPSAGRRACAASPTSRRRSAGGAACAAALPRARAGTRPGPCQLLGDLVEEALGRERVVAVADAAPGREPGAAGLDHVLGELVRDRILRDRRALHHDPVDRRRLAAGHGGRIGHDRFRHDAVMPGDHLAAGIEAGLDVVRGHRPEFAEGEVVLAAPDQLHRLADRLGEAHRIEDHLLLAAAAESAAQQMLMQA